MIVLSDNYVLRVRFGGADIPLDISQIKEFAIIQDMNRFLPALRLNISDATGGYAHILPFDRKMSVIDIDMMRSLDSDISTSFQFMVYRRFPEMNYGAGCNYNIAGLLNFEDLFSRNYSRGFKGSIKDTLTTIALQDLKLDKVEISDSLNKDKVILQPYWSTAKLLNFLKHTLVGLNDEGGYVCFIKVVEGKTVFVFKSYNDLLSGQIKYKFVINDKSVKDYIPVVDYSIYDNYKVCGILGGKKKKYSYYDNEQGFQIENDVDTTKLKSLNEYFLIDNNDSEYGAILLDNGRTNDYDESFIGSVKADYYENLMGLTKMWITTWGLEDLYPGDAVSVLFGQGIHSGEIYSYQYSGNWLVEKVVNTFGSTFKSKVLLTRSGIDTDMDTTLMKAKIRV